MKTKELKQELGERLDCMKKMIQLNEERQDKTEYYQGGYDALFGLSWWILQKERNK